MSQGKIFIHEHIDLGYDDLKAETTDNGRRYVDPNGHTYPSEIGRAHV